MLTIADHPFWRDTPLEMHEQDLLFHLGAAHEASATRGNISNAVFTSAFIGSGEYLNAVAAALLTLGGMHAPLAATMELLANDWPDEQAQRLVDNGVKVPGWGNSFVKGGPDPLWAKVDEQLEANFEALHERIELVTSVLAVAGQKVFPNPSAYTAAAALAVGLPPALAGYLFIVGRLDGWTRQLRKGK